MASRKRDRSHSLRNCTRQQCFTDGHLDEIEPVVEHRCKHAHEPPVGIIASAELAPQSQQRRRQFPVLERRAVTQGAGFGHEYRQIVPRVVDSAVATKEPRMVGEHLTAEAHDDARSIGTHLDRAPHGFGRDGIEVARFV